MKILSVLPYNVYPAYSGGQLRIFNINKFLSKSNKVEQFVWVAAGPRAIRSKLTKTSVNKNYAIYKHESFLVRAFTRIYDLIGLSPVYSFFLPLLRNKKLKELVIGANIIVVEHPWAFDYVYKLRNKYNNKAKIVLDCHNVEFLQTGFVLKKFPKLMRKSLSFFIKRMEKSAITKSDAIICMTQDDIDTFIKEFGVAKKKFFIIPTGTNINDFKPLAEQEKQKLKEKLGFKGKKIVLFCGGRYPTNAEAAKNIIKIANKEKRKDILFLIAGGVGEDFKGKSRKLDNVVFTGFVKDVKPYFKAADVAINPCVSGSGFNGKMIEYFAAGLPVISTKHGIRGIRFKENVAVCELAEFDKNIHNALDNPVLYKKMRQASLEISKNYDWSILVKKLEEILNTLNN